MDSSYVYKYPSLPATFDRKLSLVFFYSEILNYWILWLLLWQLKKIANGDMKIVLLSIIIGVFTLHQVQASNSTVVEVDGDTTSTITWTVDTMCVKPHLNSYSDSLKLERPKSNFQSTMNDITSSKIFKMTSAGVPLIIGGLIMKTHDDKFRNIRNSYAPQFNARYDDYIQYLPAATMLGLKLAGVKGRSSWGRMLVSDGFTVALMVASVNSIKRVAKVMRPDGSNNHSFPSGHTATAFMCATMLHKEYGCVSPWYSIGGYTVATLTGVSRILNNKHWISDVVTGAGIGILSTELGYFLADLIFKKKGLNEFPQNAPFDRDHKPSFLGVYMGFNTAANSNNLPDGQVLKLCTGANAGLEGALFFNPYVGVGGRFNLASMPISIAGKIQTDPLDMTSICVGPYVSYPICGQLHVGAKVMAGYVNYSKCSISNMVVGDKNSAIFSTGASFTIFGGDHFNFRFFADYNVSSSIIKGSNKSLQYLTVGSVAAINF